MTHSTPTDSQSIAQRTAAIQARIAALPLEQQAQFAHLLPAVLVDAIERRSTSAIVPLTIAQERLWFLHQLQPTDAAYNIAITWKFSGKLRLDWLQQSLDAVVQRHESLRTAIPTVAGAAMPQVRSHLSVPIAVVELDAGTIDERMTESTAIGEADAQQPFDLTQLPLLRATLVQFDAGKWDCFLTLHHIIADGWSRGILLREISQHYRHLAGLNPASPPSALSIQYADYAIWQRNWLQTPAALSDRAYWLEQLANLEPLQLPLDFPRSATASFAAATVSIIWPEPVLTALKAFSRSQQTTLFTTLLAGFQLLLHRYSGQTDIAVGVPVANRDRPELQDLIGFFVNTIVLRSDFSQDLTFAQLLQQLRPTIADGFEHQAYPFGLVVDALQPTRDLQQNPLFQVMFQFQNAAYQAQNAINLDLELPDLTVQQTWRELGTTKFDLTCHGIERSDELLWVIEYRTTRFRAATIERMLGHFQTLLMAAIAQPQTPNRSLNWLTPTEQDQTRRLGRATRNPTPTIPTTPPSITGSRLLDRLTHWTNTAPQSIALRCGEVTLTYAELTTRSQSLANHLRSRGIGDRETIVGLHLTRSIDLLIAIVAVFKVGAAYLPLDVILPAQRLQYMLTDAQPDLIITQNGEFPNFPRLNLSEYAFDRPLDPIPATFLNPDRLAYIIYTSGSTGNPKGTLLTHQGLNNYLDWCMEAYPLDRGCGAPVQSAIGFDATITSLFGPLLAGKTVHLLPEGDDLAALQAIVSSSDRFSFAKVTPAHLEILATLPAQSYPHAFVIGGEALSPSLVQQWQTLAPDTQLFNEYGPTEAVVGCCVYDASQFSVDGVADVPIGRPISGVELYVVDRAMQLQPIGIPGELYIGGLGVARGYHNRPDLNASQFIPNPFGLGRLYRTGDRAKWDSDGNLHYLGRQDTQVKLRGYRIELGEVEVGLQQYPAVTQAIVMLQGDRPQLVAYYVTATGIAIDAGDWRVFLAQKLPSYMIPRQFVWLEAIPLTANGKVDRAALPEPMPSIAADDSVEHPTDDPIVQQLVEIWQQLLGQTVRPTDNFFELGGDSILSLQAIAKAQAVGIQITPQQLFEHQTIAALSVAIIGQPAATIDTQITLGPVPLTPIQAGLFVQNLHNCHHYNQAIDLEVVAGLDADWLETSLQILRSQHGAFQLRFDQNGSDWQQTQIAPDDRPILEVIDLSDHEASAQTQAITAIGAERQASLNLTHGPIFRAQLFRLGQHDRLVIIAHHLVIDGVSWRILLGDLATLYEQHQQQLPLQLPPPTTPFQTWAKQLTTGAKSPEILAELPYWLSLGCDDGLNDYGLVSSEQHHTQRFDPETTERLLNMSRSSPPADSIEALLLTAIVEGLAIATNQHQHQLQIDLEHMGRADLGLGHLNWSRTIGWFTTLYPVKLDLTGTTTLETMHQTIQTQLHQIPHQGLGYGLLRYLNPETGAAMSAIPASTVSFNYLGQLDRLLPAFSQRSYFDAFDQLQSPHNQRSHAIKINAYVLDRCLQIRWSYSQANHSSGTISEIADKTLATVQQLVQHFQPASGCNAPTPAATSFVGARLDPKELSQFLQKIQ